MTSLILRRTAAAFAAAAVVGVGALAPAQAADGVGDVPSVSVQPAEPAEGDPNGGQWFYLELPPGASGEVKAKVSNPADVVQSVTFELRDLTFADDGAPTLAKGGAQQDVGSWGGPQQKTFELPPKQSVIVPFKVTVPDDAEPGDHVGAVLAITANRQNDMRVVRQVATRFYVSVPGEAIRAYSIVSVEASKSSTFWPSSVNTEVVLRNDGRTRVRPTVTIGKEQAEGSRLLLSRSVEKYTATGKVPWYGGPVDVSVRAVTDDGTVRTSDKSVFVIPWGLILSVVGGALLLLAVFKLVRRRMKRVSGLRADVQRLERLVAGGRAPAEVEAPEPTEADADEDAVAALLVAVKRAQRSGTPTSVARLALSLHEIGGPATSWLVGVFGKVDGPLRDEVLAALRTSDPVALASEVRRSDLSDEDKALVLSDDEPAPAPPKAVRRTPKAKAVPVKPPVKATAGAPRKAAAKASPKPPAPRASDD